MAKPPSDSPISDDQSDRNKSYWQLLQDPRWQKVRLEVMEEANFECRRCGAENKTLHVHHSYYEKNLLPWEYPPESLRCLCEDCHKRSQECYLRIRRSLGNLDPEDTEKALGYIQGLHCKNRWFKDDNDYKVEVLGPYFLGGFEAAWGAKKNLFFEIINWDAEGEEHCILSGLDIAEAFDKWVFPDKGDQG